MHGSTCEYCGTKYHIQVIDPYDIDYIHKPIEKYQVKSRHLTRLKNTRLSATRAFFVETGTFTVNEVRRLCGLEEI